MATPFNNEHILEEDLEGTIIISTPRQINPLQDQLSRFTPEISATSYFPNWMFQDGSSSAVKTNKLNVLQISTDLGYPLSVCSTNSQSIAALDDYTYKYASISPSPMLYQPSLIASVPSQVSNTSTSEEFLGIKSFLESSDINFNEFNDGNVPTITRENSTVPIQNNLTSLDEFLAVNDQDESSLSRTESIDSLDDGSDILAQLNKLLSTSSPVSRYVSQPNVNNNISHFPIEGSSNNSNPIAPVISAGSSSSPIKKLSRRASCPSSLRPSTKNPATPVLLSNERILAMTSPKKSSTTSAKRQQTFVCDICGNVLSRAANLRQHFLSVHGNARPYHCRHPNCHWSFSRANDRTRHETQHTGVRKYVCSGVLADGTTFGCGKRFRRSDGLARHFRTEIGKKCIQPLKQFQEENRENRFYREDDE